jgi:hypothetical protein
MDIQNFECRKNWGYNTTITVADDLRHQIPKKKRYCFAFQHENRGYKLITIVNLL